MTWAALAAPSTLGVRVRRSNSPYPLNSCEIRSAFVSFVGSSLHIGKEIIPITMRFCPDCPTRLPRGQSCSWDTPRQTAVADSSALRVPPSVQEPLRWNVLSRIKVRMPITIRNQTPAHAPADRRTLESRKVGALPLLDHVLEKLQLAEFLQQHLPGEDARSASPPQRHCSCC